MVRFLCGVGLLTLLLGCARVTLEQRARSHAPTSTLDVGVTLLNFKRSQLEDLLTRFPRAQVRVLNPSHGLYEIFGVKPEDIQAEPNQRIFPNKFFENKWSSFSSGVRPGIKIGDWPDCEQLEKGPHVRLKNQLPIGDLDHKTIVGKQFLEVSADAFPDASVGGDVKRAIFLLPPAASGLPEQWDFTSHLRTELSALGKYTVGVVAQDKRNACAVEMVSFSLTENQPFHPEPILEPLSSSLFPHLLMDHAPESWNTSRGENVIIAVIDTGISYNNPSLADNMWINSRENPNNGLDDDGDGFNDDRIGYDFVNNDAFPFDDDGHGTHVAGLIAAKEFGLAPKAKIMAIKAVNSFGGDMASIAAGIFYAVDHGAQILNLSLGGPHLDSAVQAALDYARDRNILVVVAAGNGDSQTGLGYDIDEIPVFPASLDNENILTVGAYDKKNSLSPYSNFGKKSVDLVAPGGLADDLIFSLSYPNPLGRRILGLFGTSMAAPQVSGAAAQVWSLHPSLSAKEVRDVLIESGTPMEDLTNLTVSGRTLNAQRAVSMKPRFVPN